MALAELGVYVFLVELHDEIAWVGPYQLPMSQSRLQTLDGRPEFNPTFMMEDEKWNDTDTYGLVGAFSQHMTQST